MPYGGEIQARILIVTAGLSGLLYSSIELARRLSSAGHRVTYAGPATVRELVEPQDLDFLAVEPSRYSEFLEEDSGSSPFHRLRHLRQRREGALRSLELESFVEAVRDLEPDLVLLDAEMHEQILAVIGLGLPIALLNTFPSIWRQSGLPPTHVMARPGVGVRGSRLAISAFWYALRLRKWRRKLVHRVRQVGCDRLSILRQLATDTGFDLEGQTDSSQWLIPFTYRAIPYLSLHAMEFEFPHQPPDNVHYVGPMVLEDRADLERSKDERARFGAILERRRTGAVTRLIYAGFGSVLSTDLDLLPRLCGVVAEHPGWELILSLSDQVEPAALGKLPDRAHLFSWVPQVRVLQYADAVVTHGGLNTLDECVLSGVPVLVYCGGETDMAGNTARVLYHGIGLAGDRNRDGSREIGQRLDHLLRESSFSSNVARLRERYEAYRQDRVAETVVESLLRQGSGFGTARDLSGGGR